MLRAILVLLLWLPTDAFLPSAPRPHTDRVRRTSVTLAMGWRDGIQKVVKKLRRKRFLVQPIELDDASSDADPAEADTSDVALERSPASAAESVQDRIRRIQTGRMTEQEKEAFLTTALSKEVEHSFSAPQKPFVMPPSILLEANASLTANAVPVNGESNSERKKREWVDQVTDPTRFRSQEQAPKSEPSWPAIGKPIAKGEIPTLILDQQARLNSVARMTKSVDDMVTLGESFSSEAMVHENIRKQAEIRAKIDSVERALREPATGESDVGHDPKSEMKDATPSTVKETKREEDERLTRNVLAQEEYWRHKLKNGKKSTGMASTVDTIKEPQDLVENEDPYSPTPSAEEMPQVEKGDEHGGKKVPIRMTIPLADDDGVDVKVRKDLSLRDALKHHSNGAATTSQEDRAKQWGIDISKFKD